MWRRSIQKGSDINVALIISLASPDPGWCKRKGYDRSGPWCIPQGRQSLSNVHFSDVHSLQEWKPWPRYCPVYWSRRFRYYRKVIFVVLSSGHHCWLHLWNPLHSTKMGSISILSTNSAVKRKNISWVGIRTWVAGWEARMLPLCYAAALILESYYVLGEQVEPDQPAKVNFISIWEHWHQTILKFQFSTFDPTLKDRKNCKELGSQQQLSPFDYGLSCSLNLVCMPLRACVLKFASLFLI